MASHNLCVSTPFPSGQIQNSYVDNLSKLLFGGNSIKKSIFFYQDDIFLTGTHSVSDFSGIKTTGWFGPESGAALESKKNC